MHAYPAVPVANGNVRYVNAMVNDGGDLDILGGGRLMMRDRNDVDSLTAHLRIDRIEVGIERTVIRGHNWCSPREVGHIAARPRCGRG